MKRLFPSEYFFFIQKYNLKVNFSNHRKWVGFSNWKDPSKFNQLIDSIVSPGSAASLAKSVNGSIKSESENSGSDIDGDNINVVIRVRPISQKEQRANDEGIIQFPGEGQIWVDMKSLFLLLFSAWSGGRSQRSTEALHIQRGVRARGHSGGYSGAQRNEKVTAASGL